MLWEQWAELLFWNYPGRGPMILTLTYVTLAELNTKAMKYETAREINTIPHLIISLTDINHVIPLAQLVGLAM